MPLVSRLRLTAAAALLAAAASSYGHGSGGILLLEAIDARVDERLAATFGKERRAYRALANVVRRRSRPAKGVADDIAKLLVVLRACEGKLADDAVLRDGLAAPTAQAEAYLADTPDDVFAASRRLERAKDRARVEEALAASSEEYVAAVALRDAGDARGMLLGYRRSGAALARAARLAETLLARQVRRGAPGQPVPKGPHGTIDLYAGTGLPGGTGDGGAALDASFYFPMDVATDPTTGLVHVADYNNHRIRFLDEDGKVRTLLRSTNFPSSGPGLSAPLDHPSGVAFDPNTGALYVAGWHGQAIVRVAPARDAAEVVNSGVAGDAGDEGPLADARLDYPAGIAFAPDGAWYVADQFNRRVRRVDAEGVIHAFAGTGVPGFSGDGGAAVLAQFDLPTDPDGAPAGRVAVSPDGGTVYVADTSNRRVRAVDVASGVIATIAGTGVSGTGGDGGPAAEAQFVEPVDVDCDGEGNVYVCDAGAHTVRRIGAADRVISTVAGVPGIPGNSGNGRVATQARLDRASGIHVDRVRGRLYIADTGNNVIRVVWE